MSVHQSRRYMLSLSFCDISVFVVSSLTETLDQLSLNLSASLDANPSRVVQPNLVVQSAQIPAANTQGIQFTSLQGQ